MAKWAAVSNFKNFYHTDMPVLEKGERVVKKLEFLQRHKFPDDGELQDLIDQFKHTPTTEDFDDYMVELYDWADINKVWIATM